MEISYRKDGTQSFMVIQYHETEGDNFKLQMALNNNIKGIIPMSIREINNVKEIYYCITSKTSMEKAYAHQKISGDELYALIKDIKMTSENMREYLLNINDIAFEREFIFINSQTGKHEFCYLPLGENNFQKNLKEFFERILKCIDYNDRKAVLIAYGVQRITANNDFTINDIMECAKNNLMKEMESHNQEQEETTEDEQICEEEIIEKETKNKSIFRSIALLFKKRENKYKDETEISNGVKENRNDFKDLRDESSLKIVLKEINTENPMEIVPSYFPYLIGKSRKRCDFVIDDSTISRVHMRITKNAGGYVVEDLNSTNGTFVNEIPLNPYEPKEVNIGDNIRLANKDFLVEREGMK